MPKLIRKATVRDWESISNISRIAGYEDYINHIGSRYLSNGDVLVYEDGDEVIGFLKVEYPQDNSCWLGGLRVHPDHRRRSVGTGLTIEALRQAHSQGIKHARLLIQDSNSRSKGLAEKTGFHRVASFAFFYGLPDTENAESADPDDLLKARYLNLGWVFLSSDNMRGVSISLLRTGNGLFFVGPGEMAQIIVPDPEITLSGDGFTCLDITGRRAPDYLSRYIDKEFDRADLYELEIDQ